MTKMILPNFFMLSLIFMTFTAAEDDLDLHEEIRILKDRLAKLESSTKKEIHQVRSELLNEMKTLHNTTMYSFYVRLHEDTILSDAPCIFGYVDLNIGDGYNEFVGSFTAPVPGLYLLTLFARTTGPMWGPMYIMKNDELLCYAELGDGATWNMGSCTAIAELTPEDTVRVMGHPDAPLTLQAWTTCFAGHLIQAYV